MRRTIMRMEQSRAYPVAIDEAFDRLLPLPLTELFTTWSGPIPPVRATEQEGVWGSPGQQRLVLFTGPGSVRETLIRVDRPRMFSYELREPTGPLALLVARVEGQWRFEPAGTGVRITWAWDVQPRGRVARAGLSVFAWFWRRYAQAALTRLEGLLLSPQVSD